MPHHRPYRPSKTDEEHVEQVRRTMAKSRELLKQPSPDTFVGRKTQEPFPKEDEN